MTLSYSNLGRNGRTGNILFQAASTIGVARKNGLAPVFPKWDYERYFTNHLPHGTMNTPTISEEGYGYKPIHASGGQDIVGYLQSPKYWEGNEAEIFDQFAFRKDFIEYFKSRSLYARVFEKPVIAIHIRRGDYVSNENYYELPVEYYTDALKKHFPDAFAMNIMIFSDDPAWVKEKFPIGQNVTVVENQSDIDDLGLMSLADHWIIANSTFSWWGAYLGSKGKQARIVRPLHHFAGPLAERADTKDLYPESWISFDHLVKISSVESQIAELSADMKWNAEKVSNLVFDATEGLDGSLTKINIDEVSQFKVEEKTIASVPKKNSAKKSAPTKKK